MSGSTGTPLNIVVLVSGYGSNLQALIRATQGKILHSRIACVISNNPEAFALFRAQKAEIPTLVVPSKGVPKAQFQSQLLDAVDAQKPDLVILAGFMVILTSGFVEHFKGRIINIHPSLLPAFPGLHAQKQAIEYGVKLTGCTVHFVDAGCDTGPIILQKAIAIEDDDTPETLSKRLLATEHQTLVEAVRLIEEDKVILQGRKTLLRIKT